MTEKNNSLAFLPPDFELETKKVLKKTAEAHRALAEFKGVAQTVPNETILINTLVLQEAKESSAVESIITTHDELFRADKSDEFIGKETKEVLNYASALNLGFRLVRENGFLSNKFILQIQAELEKNEAGFRKQAGTVLKNDRTGEVVHTPPQNYDSIVELMTDLESYINDTEDDTDFLVKMAVIHHRFETIHPFYDGNGRTGRILNILYLVLHDLLDLPILYLSRFIIRNKGEYYRLLQAVRSENVWEEWILFMLEGVIQTAKEGVILIKEINRLMADYKRRIREELPKIYSKDLLENLFKHPYTKIEFLEKDIDKHYNTVRKYLDQLCEHGFLEKHTLGKHSFYLNRPLFEIFIR